MLLLPYLDQQNIQDLFIPGRPWYTWGPEIVSKKLPVFYCPSDGVANPARSEFFGNLPFNKNGDTYGQSSYGLSKGANDALFQPRQRRLVLCS